MGFSNQESDTQSRDFITIIVHTRQNLLGDFIWKQLVPCYLICSQFSLFPITVSIVDEEKVKCNMSGLIWFGGAGFLSGTETVPRRLVQYT